MVSHSALRSAMRELSSGAAADLEVIWHRVSDAVQTEEALFDVLPGIVDQYGSAAEELAAAWYEDLRGDVNAGGTFSVDLPKPHDAPFDVVMADGIDAIRGKNPDFSAARSLIAGNLQRLIWDRSRNVLMTASISDPKARGWARVTEPGACGFCLMLETRGGVYTRETSKFGSHSNCECTATPAWKFEPERVRKYSKADASDEQRTARNTRARNWVKTNLPASKADLLPNK